MTKAELDRKNNQFEVAFGVENKDSEDQVTPFLYQDSYHALHPLLTVASPFTNYLSMFILNGLVLKSFFEYLKICSPDYKEISGYMKKVCKH